MSKTLTHLKELEAESIFILREVAAQFERPCILFSGGKDSIVLTHLAWKAFWPAKIPFRLVHIDTGHNFPETLTYRDELVARLGADLTVGSVQESIDKGRVREETGYNASRNKLQTVTLLDTLAAGKFDAAIGGARRDEEKARAKERIFSHRDEFGQWNPKNQRPELWNIYNAKKDVGEHFRVFPISNWTEMDVWQYIYQEGIEMPPQGLPPGRPVAGGRTRLHSPPAGRRGRGNGCALPHHRRRYLYRPHPFTGPFARGHHRRNCRYTHYGAGRPGR